ncbi:MAG: FHIPEP family type III secretion protein, partial [Planctomycetota bacterium]
MRAAYTGQTDLPSHFVVKMVPENEQLRAIGRQLYIYGREAAFYGEIGAGSGIRVPRCFGAQFDPDTGDTAIVLEDLSHLRTGNQYEGFTLSEAGRAVDQYAALHARWWNEPALSGFSWLPPWTQPELVAYLPTVFPAAWQGCAALFAETLSDEDRALGTLLGERLADGEPAVDPLTGRAAAWLSEARAEAVTGQGGAAFEAAAVVARSLEASVRRHADRLLSRDAVSRLVESLRASQPAVVEQIVPGVLSIARIQRTLQCLLREGVPIRPLAELLEIMSDHAAEAAEPWQLAEIVRRRLAGAICRRARDPEGRRTAVRLAGGGL